MCCAIPSPPPCSAMEPPCGRSARPSGIANSRRLRFTQKSIWDLFAQSRRRGREGKHDIAYEGIGGLPEPAERARIQIEGRRQVPWPIHLVPQGARFLSYNHVARCLLGGEASRRSTGSLDAPPPDGATLRRVRQHARPANRGPSEKPAPPSTQAKAPHIYTDEQVVDHLIEAARRLPSTVSSAAGLRAQTYAALFGLLSVTSMRISEVLALKREDVGLTEGVVTVREAKFAKSRAQNIRRLSLPDLIQS